MSYPDPPYPPLSTNYLAEYQHPTESHTRLSEQNNQDKTHNAWHPTSFHAHACQDFQMKNTEDIALLAPTTDPNLASILSADYKLVTDVVATHGLGAHRRIGFQSSSCDNDVEMDSQDKPAGLLSARTTEISHISSTSTTDEAIALPTNLTIFTLPELSTASSCTNTELFIPSTQDINSLTASHDAYVSSLVSDAVFISKNTLLEDFTPALPSMLSDTEALSDCCSPVAPTPSLTDPPASGLESHSMKADDALQNSQNASTVTHPLAGDKVPVHDETCTSTAFDPTPVTHTSQYYDGPQARVPGLPTELTSQGDMPSVSTGLLETELYTELPSSPLGFSSSLPPSSPVIDPAMDMNTEEDIDGPQLLDEPIFPSPVRSSTPDSIFSSCPMWHQSCGTPPTSSPGHFKESVMHFQSSPSLARFSLPEELPILKRTRSATDFQETSKLETPAVKREKLEVSKPPEPEHPSIALQRVQYRRLKTPFRSPVTSTTKDSKQQSALKPSEPERKLDIQEHSAIQPPKRVGTVKAASQFKSPLDSNITPRFPANRSANAVPNIQALQRKVQLLKRAIKVKADGDEQKLEELVKKWTEVGREVAWEIWAVVKDNIVTDEGLRMHKGGWEDVKNDRSGFGSGWGWNESEKGQEKEPIEVDDEKEVKEDTMGTMLRHLRIDPDTLGWDEDEGEFVDTP